MKVYIHGNISVDIHTADGKRVRKLQSLFIFKK
jgi:hypothetical protein